MYKKFSWVIMGGLLLSFYSCKEKSKNAFQVSVAYVNAEKLISSLALSKSDPLKVYLLEVPNGKDQSPVTLDSAKVPGNSGTVNLNGTGKLQGVYEVVFGDNLIAVPLINDSREIKVRIDLAKRDDFYEIEGSEASKQLRDLITNVGKKNYLIEKSLADLDSLKRSNAPDSLAIAFTLVKNNAIEDMNSYLKNFISTTSNPTLGILALSWGRSLPKADFESALNGLFKKYPDNVVIQTMKKGYDAQQSQVEQKQNESTWVGKQAPEFSMPDVNGKSVALSTFRGKYVLVDFWASWCGPCRMENPNVVKVYNEFKDKNFSILGVSLDKTKDAWQQAIQEDKLTWTQVSDLKYWSSAAVELFKFDGIPFNVLVDPQGKIIAQELRGERLENKLKELLK